MIVLAASVFILFLLFYLFSFVYKYQKKTIAFMKEKEQMESRFEQVLLQSQIEVQENTYRQVANELHDNVGQLLSTTKMLMGVTELNLGNVPDTLNTANATLSKAIQEIRLLSRSLDKEWLQQFQFLDNLREEVARINAGGLIEAKINCAVTIDMMPEKQIILFRIVQEAIQNAIRHARPSSLTITVRAGEKLIVEIENNGSPLPENFHGMGTGNMTYRSQLLGGCIQWGAGDTTVVTISLPMKNKG